MAARINLGTISIRRATTPTIPLVFNPGDLVDYTAIMRVYDSTGTLIFPEKTSVPGTADGEDLFVFTLEETTPYAGQAFYTEIDLVASDGSVPFGYIATLKIEGKKVTNNTPPAPINIYETSAHAAASYATLAQKTALEGRATAAEGRLTIIEGRATDLETRATALEASRASLSLVNAFTAGQTFTDLAGATVSLLKVQHYGAGASQTYGLDIHNYPGARSALALHQYSSFDYLVQQDNTDSQTMNIWRNTHNETLNAGRHGTGAFLDLVAYTAAHPYVDGTSNAVWVGRLEGGSPGVPLTFRSYEADTPWTFQSNTTAPSLLVKQGNAGPALSLVGASSCTNALSIAHSCATVAFNMACDSNTAGWFPFTITSQDYGPYYKTATNSGISFWVQKDGTGGGNVFRITNKGTGYFLQATNGTTDLTRIDAAGLGLFAGGVSPGDTTGAIQAGRIFQGSGVPSNSYGTNGDFYFRTDGTAAGKTTTYHKEAGTWVPAVP